MKPFPATPAALCDGEFNPSYVIELDTLPQVCIIAVYFAGF